MKRFEVKHGKYEIKRYGCDNCGKSNEVKARGTGKRNNFVKIYLCKKCWYIEL